MTAAAAAAAAARLGPGEGRDATVITIEQLRAARSGRAAGAAGPTVVSTVALASANKLIDRMLTDPYAAAGDAYRTAQHDLPQMLVAALVLAAGWKEAALSEVNEQ